MSAFTDSLFSSVRSSQTIVGAGSLARKPTESYGCSRSTTAAPASAASSIFVEPSSGAPMLPDVSITISTADAGKTRCLLTSMVTGSASSTGVW